MVLSRKLVVVFWLLLGWMGLVWASDDVLKPASKLEEGTLTNGVRYVLMPHDEPEGRVYFRLVVNAGSLNEDDDQRGIAHFVEHMAFNGSAKYPKNTIIDALERLGMKFARDINAYTDFENTVYTLNLEKNSPENLTEAVEVLNEWMFHLTILDEDVDSERGIIEEEWRRRLGPVLHLGDKKSAIEMAGSRYVERDPIGDMTIIRTIAPSRIRDFYQTWYRPDNMVVIVVGDFDPHAMKARLERIMGGEPARTSPLAQVDYSIPLQAGWRVASVSQEGISTPQVDLSWLAPYKNQNTVSAYRAELLDQIVTRLINQRLQVWEARPAQEEVESATFFRTYVGREVVEYQVMMPLSSTDYGANLQKLMLMMSQLYRDGFIPDEWLTLKSTLKTGFEKKARLMPGSLRIADDLVTSVATGSVYMDQPAAFALNLRLLDKLTLEDINGALRKMMDISSRLVLVTQPYPPEPFTMTPSEVQAWWHEAQATSQAPWQVKEKVIDKPVRHYELGTMSVVKSYPQYGLTVYKMGNGSTLVYMRTDKNPNQVFFKALRRGGLRAVPEQDFHRVRAAVNVNDLSGFGAWSARDVQKLYSHQPLALATLFEEQRQGFAGAGHSQQLQDLMVLFRLKLEGTPMKEAALKSYHQDQKTYFAEADAETEFMRQKDALRFAGHPTVYQLTQEEAFRDSTDDLTAAYDRYVLGNTDFTYFIVGDVEPKRVERLAREYLATVPVKTLAMPLTPVRAQTPQAPLVVHGAPENRAEVNLYYVTDLAWTPGLSMQLEMLSSLVEEALRASLREESSGVYAILTDFSADKEAEQITGSIEFTCDPERVDELTQEATRVLSRLAEEGFSDEAIRKVALEKLTQVKFQFDSALSLATVLEDSFLATQSPAILEAMSDLNHLAQPRYLNTLARLLLKPSQQFKATLLP